ncbi:M48 family metallopeptidase [Alsobacter sp. R-9]
MPAYGLYTHIRANRVRSVLLLAGLFVLVFLLTYAALLWLAAMGSGRAPLQALANQAWSTFVPVTPWISLLTAGWVFTAWHFNRAMIDAVSGSRAVTRAEQPRLYNSLENLCISRGIPMPKLEIIDTDVLNAFASGLNARQYTITVTSGLVAALTDEELEAVLAHELTHIRNEDVKLMVIAGIIAGVISFFGEMLFRSMTRVRWSSGSSSSSERKGGAGLAIVIAVALILVAWVLSLVIRFSLSRSREFLADAGAVELTKNPDAMISALMKVAGRGEIPGAPSAVMEMCLDNPRSGFADLFATHPPMEERIDALVRLAGGRLPAEIPDAPPPLTGGLDPQRRGPWG